MCANIMPKTKKACNCLQAFKVHIRACGIAPLVRFIDNNFQMKIKQVHCYRRKNASFVHLWDNLARRPSRTYKFKGKGNFDRAAALAELLAADNGARLEIVDMR